ncbi:MAG: TlyA family RNA methyltransferase [Microthrixaceae bacterium]|nr:TlyA family RNA methyltransferase [Microthrixaceae bacterium]
MRRRLDNELVRRGLAESRSAARELVKANQVLVSGSLSSKSSRMVDPGDPVVLVGSPPRFVGRGGEKLAAALEEFALDMRGLRVLGAGASTGGFTDCLLQAGAGEVLALDVGHGQLHESLRAHPGVVVMERTNLRHVSVQDVGGFDAAVADLSFISLTLVLDALFGLVGEGGWLVLLVKPQFECGRAEVSRGRGVVRDPSQWSAAVTKVADAVRLRGGVIMGAMVSPLRGGDGNVEFLLHVEAPATAARHAPQDVDSLIADVVESAALREGLL